MDKKESERFNDNLIQKYGENIKNLSGDDKSRFEELKKVPMPTKEDPERTALTEYLKLAWERARLEANYEAQTRLMNKK